MTRACLTRLDHIGSVRALDQADAPLVDRGDQADFQGLPYEPDDQHSHQPRASHIGRPHGALYAEEMDAAVAYHLEQDVVVLGGRTASRGASEDHRSAYPQSPWGMQFPLVSYPRGDGFDHDASEFGKGVL